jgi:2-oxoglutarate ferredoxin oxidoreductase subunit delta
MEKRVVFDEKLCKGCKLCIEFCPVNIVALGEELNEKGYRTANVIEQDKCTSCRACAIVCPDNVITVYRPKK